MKNICGEKIISKVGKSNNGHFSNEKYNQIILRKWNIYMRLWGNYGGTENMMMSITNIEGSLQDSEHKD